MLWKSRQIECFILLRF